MYANPGYSYDIARNELSLYLECHLACVCICVYDPAIPANYWGDVDMKILDSPAREISSMRQ